MDRGIAGYVASTGQVLNIEDAYTDDRFNRLNYKENKKVKVWKNIPSEMWI